MHYKTTITEFYQITMKKSLVAGIGLGAIALAYAAKDPVIMTVNGVDVPKSEFEYLYKKNSQQQVNPQTLEEYVEMFKLYKMKVADARAEHLDTVASFVKETEQYRHELAAPYLADSVFMNKLVDAAYDRSKTEVEAKHIMLFKTRDAVANRELRQRADSLHAVLKGGKSDFGALAAQYSGDRGSSARGGRMGWIVANTFPYAFEEAAWNTPEGEISEVVESPVGYHILKGGKKRPARGKVSVAHILRLTKDLDEAGKAQAKHDIDSIYELVKANPERFAEIAMTASQDPGSARQGGKLPLFGAGEMVEQFDQVAFDLADGEISEPFLSDFGWHIIKRYEGKGIQSRDEIKPAVLSRMTSRQDPRYKLIRDNQTKKLAKKHGAKLNAKTVDALRQDVGVAGIDSAFVAKWSASNAELVKIGKKSVPAKDYVATISSVIIPDAAAATEVLDESLETFYNKELVTVEEDRLMAEVPDYRNLLKEYVDGSLLYEVSVRKVWDKASKDTEGLQRYFDAHRDDYVWNEPHAKGFLVQAANDSVAELIKARAMELGRDTLVNTIRKEFTRQAGIDKVLVSKGTNPMVDNLMFGGPKVEPSKASYQVYFMIDPRTITVPEELSDVKGLVTGDYQNAVQAVWEDELRKTYPVTVNQKVLDTVK